MVIAIARLSILEDGKVPEFEGKKELDKVFDFTVSLAWFGLSLGIILGSYWAYITLGYGGFWAWDPVETGSLIPWLFLTIYYHGKSFYKRDFLPNYLISMGYVSTLFITYLTRSGVVSSVHAFVPDQALESFLSTFIPEDFFLMSLILRVIPTEKIFFIFIAIIITFLLPLYLGIKNREILKIPISFSREDFTKESRYQITALKISFISILIGTYVIIIGLIAPVIYDMIGYIISFSPEGFSTDWLEGLGFSPSITIGPSFYNLVITFFGGFMLLAQFFCTFYPRISTHRKFQLLIGGAIAGVLFSITGLFYRNGDLETVFGTGNPIIEFLANFWTTSEKANLVLPLILLGIIGLVIEFANITLKDDKNILRKSSQTMLHLSFLLILVGALVSTNTTFEGTLTVDSNTENVPVPGTSLRITVVSMDKLIPEDAVLMNCSVHEAQDLFDQYLIDPES